LAQIDLPLPQNFQHPWDRIQRRLYPLFLKHDSGIFDICPAKFSSRQHQVSARLRESIWDRPIRRFQKGNPSTVTLSSIPSQPPILIMSRWSLSGTSTSQNYIARQLVPGLRATPLLSNGSADLSDPSSRQKRRRWQSSIGERIFFQSLDLYQTCDAARSRRVLLQRRRATPLRRPRTA